MLAQDVKQLGHSYRDVAAVRVVRLDSEYGSAYVASWRMHEAAGRDCGEVDCAVPAGSGDCPGKLVYRRSWVEKYPRAGSWSKALVALDYGQGIVSAILHAGTALRMLVPLSNRQLV